jgi:basic membrane protein A and related proteins
MNLNRRLFLALMSGVSALVLGAGRSQAAALRVAIVMPGNITDKSWNQAGYEGIMAAKAALGLDVAYSEKVPPPDLAEAMADYARRGYKVVIGHGGQFQDAVEHVAAQYPNTIFVVNSGKKAGGNVATADFNYGQFGYLLGYIAAKMSKTGKAGFIGAQKVKFCTDLNTSYEAGLKAAGGKEVLTAWTNDWDDIAKGKEAALSQMSQGADVIFPTMDNGAIGSLQACKEKGAWSFGLWYDAIVDWPDTVLQSAIFDVRGAMMDYLTIAAEGKLEGKNYKYDLTTPKAARLGTFNKAIPDSVKAEVLALAEKMKSGELKP